MRSAESKAVTAVLGAEGSAEAKLEAISGTTATLKDWLGKAKHKEQKAHEEVLALQKSLTEQQQQPEKIDSDLATARGKACKKLLDAIQNADRAFQRTAYRFIYGHSMATNGHKEGLYTV